MIILLTGATSGIGFETLKQLIAAGHTVYAIGRDFSKIDFFIQNYKSQIFNFNFDFNQVEQIDELFSKFNLENQKFDALVHCAGVEETLPLSLYSASKVRKIFDVNVFSGIELLRHFTKKKYCNDGAGIVFLSSVMGTLGQPGKIGYCATKAAVLGVVKSGALEFAKRKIRINAVLPGIINTPMTKKLFSQINDDQIMEIENMHPLGFGEVEDVVPTILFLISKNSRWITGQSFVIDGGYSIQ
ncbi:SDR family oxidoreductase [Flavobacterium branchiarum]|uniref:SDR family NAD(P)-dependent oxidoreductase n=1 Tax=Flavobacterium branchiarum TaxID=1114870 RepID=A0ABV5FNW4_9FLAO|nr:SDR family oxidoreductase [Flavobacterium branchiarum]MDN3671916.1 SDR family oxidoreductase [Flavobacterium branchiarum]